MSILQMSISAGVLIIAIAFIRLLALNKLPKQTFLVLWGVVVCRLLIPFSLSSRFSIYSVIRTIINAQTPIDLPPDMIRATVRENYIHQTPQIVAPVPDNTFFVSPTMLIWLVGVAIMVVFFTVAYYRNCKELKTALPLRDNTIVSKWLEGHSLMSPLHVLVSDRITTPISIGIIRPYIILPKSMNTNDDKLMQHVLTHEYLHLKNLDMLWKMILILSLCVHWFNPLVWVMFVLSYRDLELACDEKVIRYFGAEMKADYALSLIGMAEQRSKFTPLYNGFSKNAIEERIVSIMKMKKVSFVSIVLACFLVLGITTAFATSAANPNIEYDSSIYINAEAAAAAEQVSSSASTDGGLSDDTKKIFTSRQEFLESFKTLSIDLIEKQTPPHSLRNGQIAIYSNNGEKWNVQKNDVISISLVIDPILVEGHSTMIGYQLDGVYHEVYLDKVKTDVSFQFTATHSGEYGFFIGSTSSDPIRVQSFHIAINEVSSGFIRPMPQEVAEPIVSSTGIAGMGLIFSCAEGYPALSLHRSV